MDIANRSRAPLYNPLHAVRRPNGTYEPPPYTQTSSVTTSVPPPFPPPWFYHMIGVDGMTEREIALERDERRKEAEEREQRRASKQETLRLQPRPEGLGDEQPPNVNPGGTAQLVGEGNDEAIVQTVQPNPTICIPSQAPHFTTTSEVPLGAKNTSARHPTVGMVFSVPQSVANRLEERRRLKLAEVVPPEVEDAEGNADWQQRNEIDESALPLAAGLLTIEASRVRVNPTLSDALGERFAALLPSHSGGGRSDAEASREDKSEQQRRSQRIYAANVNSVRRNLLGELRMPITGTASADGRYYCVPPTPRGHAQSFVASHQQQLLQRDRSRRLNELFFEGSTSTQYSFEQHRQRVEGTASTTSGKRPPPPPPVAGYVYHDTTTPRILPKRCLHPTDERSYLLDSASFYGTEVRFGGRL